ncbi:pyrroline-5-carboxylate reductase [Candidatus Gracilibacteria bacterium]|nr:pyrroline-5-carboxylate reductase [Candidatus Gracilibacteria bacterium]
MKLGILGCGNMGEAFLKSVLTENVFSSEEVLVCNKTQERNDALKTAYGVSTTLKAEDLRSCDVVLLGIKPQNLSEIQLHFTQKAIVISMLAGTPIDRIRSSVKGNAAFVRIMPNLGQFVGKGITGLFFDTQSEFSEEERQQVKEIIEAGGAMLEFSRESQIDALTSISGCGPAYFFFLGETLECLAQEMGFSEAEARVAVRQTFLGAARLLEQNETLSFREATQRVASKGGVTERALEVLKELGWEDILKKALLEADKKGRELGKEH